MRFVARFLVPNFIIQIIVTAPRESFQTEYGLNSITGCLVEYQDLKWSRAVPTTVNGIRTGKHTD